MQNINLRPLQATDRAVIASLINNKNVWDNLRDYIPFPYSPENADLFIEFCQSQSPVLTFGIEFQAQLCGVIGLVPQTDIYRKSAEIGYWIGEHFWGKGIASQAIKLMLDYGFEVLDINRIYAGVFVHNLGSIKALEKNGFKKEGLFEKSIIKNNQFFDEYRLAILKP